jgi:hypothetical protein
MQMRQRHEKRASLFAVMLATFAISLKRLPEEAIGLGGHACLAAARKPPVGRLDLAS